MKKLLKLENSLKVFNASDYDPIFKEKVSWWVETRIYELYNNLPKVSDEEINSVILNFEWYEAILRMLCRTYDLFHERLFSVKDPEDPTKTLSCISLNVNLVTHMLDVCTSIIGKSDMQKVKYKEQLEHLKKLKKCYDKFIGDTQKHIDNIFSSDYKYRYLMGAELEQIFIKNPIATLINDIETDIKTHKPKKVKHSSQKQSNNTETKVNCVMKIIYEYLCKFFRIDEKIVVHNYYDLICDISNELIMDIDNRTYAVYDREDVKGILGKCRF